MSRGPGKWQRAILNELGERECFYLLELLPVRYRKAHYNALNRAALVLLEKGKIDAWRWMGGNPGKVLYCRPGYEPPRKPGGEFRERPAFNHARPPIVTTSTRQRVASHRAKAKG